MLRVGLTGGIGSGKSEVARRLAAAGAVVIDADVLAREVVAPGTPGLAEVVAAFGPEVLQADGSLDRERVAAIVFNDEAERRRLNQIVHPLVGRRTQEITAEVEATRPDAVVVHDVPLLVESGLAKLFDVVVVVAASVDTQVRRLVQQRGMAEADARARIRAQASLDERLAVADHVVWNEGDLSDLDRRVAEVWRDLCARAAGAGGR